MSEKTMEELQAELKILKEINAEQGKIKARSIRSKLPYDGEPQHSMEMRGTEYDSHRSLTQFRNDFIETRQDEGLNMQGKTYEQIMHDLTLGKYKRKPKQL